VAIQYVLVCTQDAIPSIVNGAIDCSGGVLSVANYSFTAGIEAFGSLLSLSAADASAIGFAVLGVWGVAFGIKAAILTLKGSNHDEVE
jgi:hypothetical protein